MVSHNIDSLPSVVQAVAAIISLIVATAAILIASGNERRRLQLDEEVKYHNAQGIAVGVYPDLLRIKVSLDTMVSLLHPETGNPPSLVFDPARAALGLYGAKFVIPFMLHSNLNRLHWLPGEAGPTVTQLVSVIMQHNELVDQVLERVKLGVLSDFNHAIPFLDGHLRLIERIIDKAERLLQPLHDGRRSLAARSLLDLLLS
jgi:hypothetical protein